jgi:hypothetical protein
MLNSRRVVSCPQGLCSTTLNYAAECPGGLACLVGGVMINRRLRWLVDVD